jgi:hypothetical protein
MDMREKILSEIRRIAKANGGKPPGVRLFGSETGITLASWRGIYWVRWSEALIEAGFSPNNRTQRFSDDFVFQKLAEAVRYYRKVPTEAELRFYRSKDPNFPNDRAIQRRFKSKNNIFQQLKSWAETNSECTDVVLILENLLSESDLRPENKSKEGYVYLLKSGHHYKIGNTDNIERRIKEIRVNLPEAVKLVHSIRTDDPSGIEAYWHRRFEDRRANGEWFKLSASDVAAFKRRKSQ